MRSRQGEPVRRYVKAPVNLVASSTSSKDVRDPYVGYSPVEVSDQVSGPVRHGGFRPFDAEHAIVDATAVDRTGSRRGVQRAQAFVQRELALGEPVLRIGRDRHASVVDGGRQQRLSDIAVAARPRQPDVAGAERIAQVVGCAVESSRRTSTASSKGLAADDALMSSVRSAVGAVLGAHRVPRRSRRGG